MRNAPYAQLVTSVRFIGYAEIDFSLARLISRWFRPFGAIWDRFSFKDFPDGA